jgi:hypothetical protein
LPFGVANDRIKSCQGMMLVRFEVGAKAQNYRHRSAAGPSALPNAGVACVQIACFGSSRHDSLARSSDDICGRVPAIDLVVLWRLR